ncbi:MAG TPA: DUF1080 domain-containing protein [Pseudomonas sp.]|nr:DUF1080 domain-containing protein [Pseudomonas sp.]
MQWLLDSDQWRGWHTDDFPAGSWRSRDGELQAIAGAPRVDLVSRRRYRDFIFRFEFALPVAGNSGVLCRVEENAVLSWHSGPEMQLLDDAGHPDGREPTTRNGALYGLLAAEPDTPVEPGEFIDAALVAHDGHVEHWLRGRCVVRYRLDDPGLRASIARSKFAGFPRFAQAAEGHLVLQHHGEAARFRRLSIEMPD